MNITFFTDSRCNDGLIYSAEVYINYCEEPEHCQKTLHPRSAVYYLEACLGERSGFIYIPEFPDDDDDYIEIRLCFQEVYEFSYEVKADITEFFEVE